MPFGTRREDAIFVATNAGTVAALRAVDGSVLWKRQVSAATLIPACNITYGISSTPVLDRARGRLYAIGSDGLLHALSLATGEEVDGGWPLRIVQLTGAEYVWSGLTLRGNRLYVPVASFCDKPDLDGYVATAGSWRSTSSILASSPRSTSQRGRTTWAASGATQA